MKKLKIVKEKADENRILGGWITQKAQESEHITILEAGCGRQWTFDVDRDHTTMVGIDLDKKALDIRREVGDLDEIIYGDLLTHPFEAERFDVIYCAYVLEHVEDVKVLMDNFHRWLKPGGIMILLFPHRDSVFGWYTRMLPHSLHVFFKKYIQGVKNAGKPGFAPYPTFYHELTSRKKFLAYAEKNNLKVEEEFGRNNFIKRAHPVVQVMLHILVKVTAFFSLGSLYSNHNNLHYVLRKAPAAGSKRQQALEEQKVNVS